MNGNRRPYPLGLVGLIIAALFTVPLAAKPLIFLGGVNSANFMPPGLPSGAIARGSVFTVFGSGGDPPKECRYRRLHKRRSG